MNGYWDSPELIYVGNTKVTRGWQTLLDGYEELSKTSGGQIGTLELEETQITVLSKITTIFVISSGTSSTLTIPVMRGPSRLWSVISKTAKWCFSRIRKSNPSIAGLGTRSHPEESAR